MKPAESFQPGDVLSVNRVLYKHYGIYTGKGRVIHYAADNGDFGASVRVRETSLEQFAKGGKCRIALFTANRSRKAKQFSPRETVKRARSRLGEKHYNLLFNNCEHFALWCKYGTSKSVQVERAFTTAVLASAAVVIGIAINTNEQE